MLIPLWFDSEVYFANKLAALGGNYNELTLIAAFQAADYNNTPEGMYQHFLDYGNAEGVSPNGWFKPQEYLYNKAVSYFGRTNVTTDQIKSMQKAMTNGGMSPWDHFNKYWAEYYADGNPNTNDFLNPSADFDVQKYMDAKLAAMQKDDPNYSMKMLVEAFDLHGLNPVQHYLLYGKDENLVPEPVGGTVPGNAVMLTPGEDVLFGTSGADYFYAKLGSLNDQDYIDGLGGSDTLYANMEAGKAIAPEITNVETLLFRVQQHEGGGGNNLTQGNIDAEFISLDKGQMLTLGSDNSRAHLTIEDIRHFSNETVIRFSNTDPGVDFKAYFHDQWLADDGTRATGSMYIQLMDVRNGHTQNKPLYNNPFTNFIFQYTDTAGKVQYIKLELGPVKGDATYGELLKAFQDALAASEVAGKVTADLGGKFTGKAFVGGGNYTYEGDLIVLKATDGSVAAKMPDGVTNIPGTGWGVGTGTVPPSGGIVWNANNFASTTCPLLTTTIALDNVGHLRWTDSNTACLPDNSMYGSQAGEMIVGIMGGRGGLERFDVVVDQSSWLTKLDSSNESLRMVKVVNGGVNGVNDQGHLFIGRSLEAMKTTSEPGGEATDLGTVAWMNIPRLLSTDGLTDVKLFDSTAMQGNVNIGAQLTAKCYEKYLKDVDGILDMEGQYAPNGAFQYLFGKGKDTLNLQVNTGIAADRDFLLKINMGDGDDLLNFAFTEPTGSRVMDQIALNNVRVELGQGDNEAWFFGSGAVDVKAGTGNNAIFTGQNTSQNAVFVMGSSTAAFVNIGPDGAQPLFSDVTSTQTTGIELNGGYGITSKHYVELLVNFDGIRTEKVIISLTDKQKFISVEEANSAVIYAIENDPTLSKLLRVSSGMNSSLIVEHLGNGKFHQSAFQVLCNLPGSGSGIGITTGGVYGPTRTDSYVARTGVEPMNVFLRVIREGSAGSEIQEIVIAEDIFSEGLPSDLYTLIYQSAIFLFPRGDTYSEFAANMQTALNVSLPTFTVTYQHNSDGTWSCLTHSAGGYGISNDTVLVKGKTVLVEGSETGTVSMATVQAGPGDDLIVFNNSSAHNAFDTLVIKEAFGDDVLRGFNKEYDKIDMTAFGADGKVKFAFAIQDTPHYGLDGKTLSVASGKSIVLLENTNLIYTNEFFVFEVISADNTISADDTVILLGTLNLGTQNFDNNAMTIDNIII